MPNPTLPHPSPKRHSLLIFACLCHTVREALPNGCSPDGASSSLVYVAEPQDYEGARAACAARGGALANVGSLAEAYGSGWTGDPEEIWIADSGYSGDADGRPGSEYDTCHTSLCPCINCAETSEPKPFICDTRPAVIWDADTRGERHPVLCRLPLAPFAMPACVSAAAAGTGATVVLSYHDLDDADDVPDSGATIAAGFSTDSSFYIGNGALNALDIA